MEKATNAINRKNSQTQLIQLLKMHGAKNYFIIYDARIKKYQVKYPDLIKKISCHSVASSALPFALYFDQFIVIDFPKNHKANCFMQIFNQDSSEVDACGNATRCVAKIIMDENSLNSCIIQTNAGLLSAHKSGEDIVVNMGAANEMLTTVANGKFLKAINIATRAINPKAHLKKCNPALLV